MGKRGRPAKPKPEISVEKRPVGRPTKYRPEFCERVIEMGKYGASKHEMAAKLDIHYDNFKEWQEKHPEFHVAVKQSLYYSQAWWEENGRTATFGGCDGFNATSYIFNMKNRFKEDWRDRVETDNKHTHEVSEAQADVARRAAERLLKGS
jgi:transposase